MSAEEAVTDAIQKPVEQNAEAAADAKKMLAELDAEQPTESKPDLENREAQKDVTGDDAAESKDSIEAKSEAKDNEEEKSRGDRGKDRDYNRRDNGDRRGGRGSNRGRGGRGGGHARDNIKSVLTVEEKSSDHDAIRKQVEFYFSDSNLPMDQFLLNKVGGSLNNPVDLELIRTFKRMRHFEPLEAIIEALKTSKTVNLVDNDTKVQRKQPLAKSLDNGVNTDQLRVYEDKAMPRSVYVKGFGPEIPSTQFDIEAFFAAYGPTNAIRLRRTDDKLFKGSVFVEFENEDLANTFLALDPKPKYQDRELQIMSKKEYCDKKVDDIKAGRIRAGRDRGHGDRDNRKGGRGGNHGKRRRDDDDDRDWRTRRDEDRKTGFRDDKRRDRDGRDGGRGGRDKRSGGRERRRSVEKDDRGIPVVKSSTDTDRNAAKEDAIAKARAAVEEENSKENGSGAKVESTFEKAGEANTEDASSKKRQRTDDADAPSQEPAAKKVDSKSEA